MTEAQALVQVEAAARATVEKAGMSQRGYEWAKLRDALAALDRAREEAAQPCEACGGKGGTRLTDEAYPHSVTILTCLSCAGTGKKGGRA